MYCPPSIFINEIDNKDKNKTTKQLIKDIKKMQKRIYKKLIKLSKITGKSLEELKKDWDNKKRLELIYKVEK